MKIYFLRHQADGVLHSFPFAKPPTEAQIAAVKKLCDRRHGNVHPKLKEPYWMIVEEVDVLGAEVPEVPEPGQVTASDAALQPMTVSGVGHVENPKEH